ncbi:MAG: hypothetical protein F4Z01_00345 [Gammaproteobacteria bacterium]|nr:hypothetical protein [Gammaproteobacteria bacterium]MYF38913.1 hypothetical protein [Gammaproteobacteria bacterium]
MKIKKIMFVTVLLLLTGAVLGEEYEEKWGPEVGSDFPELAVKDTEGNDRSVDELRGENKGLLIFFVRTTDW